MAIAAVIVLIPGVPLIPILFLTQALNAVLLVPLLVVSYRLSGDTRADGRVREHAGGARPRRGRRPLVLIGCVLALGFVSVT